MYICQNLQNFNRLTKGYKDEQQLLYKDLSDLNKKIERLEERYINEEIKTELYNKYSEKYEGERREIEKRLSGEPKKSSNFEKYVDWTLEIALKLAPAWRLADYRTKQNRQFLLFPDGITYNKNSDGVRTSRVNLLFMYVAYFKQLIGKNKRGIPELGLDFASFSSSVARRRFAKRLRSNR